jgi:hypothetical protein
MNARVKNTNNIHTLPIHTTSVSFRFLDGEAFCNFALLAKDAALSHHIKQISMPATCRGCIFVSP